MCIAIYKPKKKRISKDSLALCFMNNPDGAGFAFAHGGRVHIRKGYMSFQDFWDVYKNHQGKACSIHFRLSTHGGISKENCHPFRLSEGCAMIHNGVIPSQDTDKETSDTRAFVRDIVKPAFLQNWKFLYAEYGKRMLSGLIGNSKLVFLNKRGRAVIINAEKGHWSKGVWYSNTTYKTERGFKPKKAHLRRVTSTATARQILGGSGRSASDWIPPSERGLHYEPDNSQLEMELSEQAEEELQKFNEDYARRQYRGFSIVEEAEGLLGNATEDEENPHPIL